MKVEMDKKVSVVVTLNGSEQDFDEMAAWFESILSGLPVEASHQLGELTDWWTAYLGEIKDIR